jgi:hypothetical protein
MANNERDFSVRTRKSDVILRTGKFTGNTSSNGTLESGGWQSLITAATHSSTGVFALTFDKKYPGLDFPTAYIVNGTTAYLRATITAIDVTAGTATLKTDVNGTLTDPGTSDVIYVKLLVRNSGRNS